MTLSKFKVVGVEFAVERLSKFRSDMASAGKSMDNVKKKGSLLGKVFSGAGKLLGGFLTSLKRIGEFVIAGVLLRAFDAITGAIRRMISTVFDAGLQFQEFTLRIQQFAAQELFKESGGAITFEEALERTKETAKELLDELALFAIRSPFETIDVVKIFSLSKAFGFAGENAKEVTKQALNMAAGLGIGAIGAERIIRNLGQMNRLGRVMQRDLNDLANAGINVAGIMDRVAMNTGVTTEELKKLQKKGLVPASAFLLAFSQIADEEFAGSAERMNKTLKAALGNVKDLVGSFIGLKVVKPILDVLGTRLANFLDVLSSGERGEKLIKVLERIGTTLAGITELFFGNIPSGESLADTILKQLDNLANRLFNVKFFLESETFQGFSTKDKVQTILDLLGLGFLIEPLNFVSKVKENIETAVGAIKDVIDRAIGGFEGGGIRGLLFEFVDEDSTLGTVIDGILKILEKFALFWEENKDNLIKIWTDLLQPIAGFVLDLALIGLNSLIDFLGTLADWARENPVLAKDILAVVSSLAALKVILTGPVQLGFLVALGSLRDVLSEDSKIVEAVDKFTKAIADGITGFADIFVKELENAIALAGKLGKEFIGLFVLAIVQSDIFKFFQDEIVVPLGKLMGETIPTSAELAARVTSNLQELNQAGRDIGQAIDSGIQETLDPQRPSLAIVDSFLRGDEGFFKAGQVAGIGLNQGLISTAPLFKGAGTIIGQNIITGIVDGINQTRPVLTSAMGLTGQEALEAFKQRIGARSPAKEFAKLGITIPQGIAQGIMKAARLPVQAISMISNNVQMAAQVPSVTNNSSVQNFNMNIKTNARSEPIIGNFRQMQALGSL